MIPATASGESRQVHHKELQLPPRGVKLNFWPEIVAAYINPPLAMVNTAMPLWEVPFVLASDESALAPELAPVVPAPASAPAVTATALASAPNSKSSDSNASSARLSSKKMISL